MLGRTWHSILSIAVVLLLDVPGHAQHLTAEDRDWIQARSAHFQLFTDCRKGSIEEVVEDLETLRAVLAQTIPGVRQGKLKLESPV